MQSHRVSASGSEIMQQNEMGEAIVAVLEIQRVELWRAKDSSENFREYVFD